MSRWDEIRDAVEPTADEVDRLVEPLDPRVAEWAADATAPSAAEVAALRRAPVPSASAAPVVWPRLAAGAGGLLALAAAVALAIGVPDVEDAATGVPIGPAFHLEGDGAHIDGAVTLMGVADVRVVTVSPTVTEVEITQGAVAFEHLEPRRLVVRAGDVLVEAGDARFEIVVLAGSVEVTVARGDAVARVGDRLWAVTPGERWSWPLVAEAAIDAEPVQPPEVPLAVPLPVVEIASPSRPVAATPVAATPVAPVAAGPVAAGVPPAVSAPVAPEAPVAAGVPPAVSAPTVSEAEIRAAFDDIVDRWSDGSTTSATIAELDRLLAAHPTSRVAEDAMVLRLRLRVDEGPPEAALQEMEAWLSLSPRSPRRAEVLGLAAGVAREQLDDCVRALPHYRDLASATGAAEAHAWHGLCAVRAGYPDQARPALEAAMAAGLTGPLGDQAAGVLDRLR